MHRACLLPLVLLAGCAADRTAYPSLALRPAEGRSWAEPATPPPAVAQPDPALDARIGEQSQALANSARQFDAAADRASALAAAARGQAVGSERWLSAQSALGDLDVQRAGTAAAGDALHQLALERATTGAPDYPALEEATAAADAQLQAEVATVARLQSLLPLP